MPSPTYVALAKAVSTGSSTTVTFSSIPSTYTDLILLFTARSNGSSGYIFFNNQTAPQTTYSQTFLYNAGSSVLSGRNTNTNGIIYFSINSTSATANTFSNVEIYIPNYSGSTNKCYSASIISEDNVATTGFAYQNAQAGLWTNTAAINAVSIISTSGNFVSGSRFDLYGIKNS